MTIKEAGYRKKLNALACLIALDSDSAYCARRNAWVF
jgi:hypothetical protein